MNYENLVNKFTAMCENSEETIKVVVMRQRRAMAVIGKADFVCFDGQFGDNEGNAIVLKDRAKDFVKGNKLLGNDVIKASEFVSLRNNLELVIT